MYYAVAKGRTTGIFTTWDEAKREVTGYKGAVFKKFKTLEEAKAFLASEGDEAPIERTILPGELHAYVDGSYAESGTYSYGAVLLTTDGASSRRLFMTRTAPCAMSRVNFAGRSLRSTMPNGKAMTNSSSITTISGSRCGRRRNGAPISRSRRRIATE